MKTHYMTVFKTCKHVTSAHAGQFQCALNCDEFWNDEMCHFTDNNKKTVRCEKYEEAPLPDDTKIND